MSTSDEIGEPDGDQFLVAEYALGLLDAGEHQRVAARIAADPALAGELRFWRLRLSGLNNEFAETPAPTGTYERIERRLFSAAAKPSFWNSLAVWRGLAAAGLAVALLGVGFGTLVPRTPLSGPELAAALEATGSDVKFVAIYNQTAGTVKIAALSGAAVPNKDFELWAIKGNSAPVSLGVVPIDSSRNVPLSAALKQGFGAGTVLAVTLEQKGGSPDGNPHGQLVAKGAAIAI
jgi:anti-sigma-K factor RskA